ncbi:hypothetical protein RRG08_046995 [Elysia crispata]|uniref:Uncharacterized protein n=1 Tax=Elysia crispata TaxID=231223 RepID=A0AAE1A8D6_9GAST|nr:hypothetical protein RRG08_046995 [Elysia crispata]
MSLLGSQVKEGRPSQYDSARGLDAVKPSNKRPVKSEKKKFAANLKRVTAIANYNIEYKKRINLGLNGEGGRLERELDYVHQTIGEGSGTTYELVIQTQREGGPSLLSVDSVLLHYRSLLAATKIEIHVGGISWSFRDLCYAVDFPITETYIVDLILEKILPCVIITPIDCFWEGSRLLGPDLPVATGASGYLRCMPTSPTFRAVVGKPFTASFSCFCPELCLSLTYALEISMRSRQRQQSHWGSGLGDISQAAFKKEFLLRTGVIQLAECLKRLVGYGDMEPRWLSA